MFAASLLRSKVFIWTLLVLPGLWPAWPLFVQQDPSALTDPLKFILLHFGFVACVLLATVLTFTPLRVLFPKWDVALALNRHRRLVGVCTSACRCSMSTTADLARCGRRFKNRFNSPGWERW
jgi:DMSO/TMAO reductase YedYZ heme-binding membrane subunit